MRSKEAVLLMFMSTIILSAAQQSSKCADGSNAWKESNGTAQVCSPSSKCPSGYSCTSSICCPVSSSSNSKAPNNAAGNNTKPARATLNDADYCDPNQKVFRRKDAAVKCNEDSDCLPPSDCSSKKYCCLQPLNQEAPPVGCPFGSRPLKNANGQQISCVAGQPGSCPGNTLCYQDSVTSTYHCCGKDPGEGCPSGSRASKSNGRVVPCTPGSASNGCSGRAMCQWSYIIDRYQCCEPDDGCPINSAPLITSSNRAQMCKIDGSSPCPSNYACEFNFWTASYQCCGRDIGVCPGGQVPYVEYATSQPRQCNSAQVGACPTGYVCTQASSGQFVCCGQAGRCPASMTLITDAQGRATACSPSLTNGGCQTGASCQQSIGGVQGQYLCCSFGTGTSCQSGRTPYPSPQQPQTCVINIPGTCPFPAQCELSNVAGRYVCCSNNIVNNNVCPAGWTMTNNQLMYCSPATQTCATGGTCLQHQTITNQFVCCSPGSTSNTQYTCPVGAPSLIGTANRFCGAGGATCPAGSVCQQAANAPGTFICCTVQMQQAYTCPGNGQPYRVGSQYNFCTQSSQTCPPGYTCQQSTNLAQPVFICCTGSGAGAQFQCGGSGTAVISNGANQFCNPSQPNSCIAGSSCQQSSTNPSVQICCYGNSGVNTLRCGNGATPYSVGGQNIYCNRFQQPSTCPTGNDCQTAIGGTISNPATTGICCNAGTSPSQFTCPSQYQAQTSTNGQPIFCNQQNPLNCPGGSACLPSQNAPQYSICCRAGGTNQLCPAGQQALLLVNQQPQYCQSPNDPCFTTGYTCQVSPTMSRYLCCGNPGQITARCSNNQPFYPQASGTPMVCNPTAVGTCPTGYDCATSTVATQYICCLRSFVQTPTACSTGRTPYQPIGTNSPMVCTPGSTFCPPGTLCDQSNIAGQFICCNVAPSNNNAQCPTGWFPSLSGTQPQRCNSIGGTTCAVGFSCTQSNIQGTFLCCQFGSGTQTARCQDGSAAFTNSNNQAQTCNLFSQTCPAGYTCGQSTVGTNICCASRINVNLRCANGQSPYPGINNQPLNCARPNVQDSCPTGYTCSTSTQAGRYVCCIGGGTNNVQVCRSGAAYTVSGQPQTCQSSSTCPAAYNCESSVNNPNLRYCCQGARCPTGVTINPTICTPGTFNTCPNSFTCTQSSNIPGTFLCCNSFSQSSSARCIGRGTQMSGNNAVSCRPTACSSGYECSAYTTSGQYICCSVVREQETNVCPNNRNPYKDNKTGAFYYCDSTNYQCPDGYVCKQNLNAAGAANSYVCCSEIPSCQRGWLPYKDQATGDPKSCSPYGSTSSCSPTPGWPYKCQQSTVPSTYLCCMESAFSKYVDEQLGDATQNTSTSNPLDTGDSTTPLQWITWAPATDSDQTGPAGKIQVEDPTFWKWTPENDDPAQESSTTISPQDPTETTKDGWFVWNGQGD